MVQKIRIILYGIVIAGIASLVFFAVAERQQRLRAEDYSRYLSGRVDSLRVETRKKDKVVEYSKPTLVTKTIRVASDIIKYDTVYAEISKIEPVVRRIEHAHVIQIKSDSCISSLKLNVVLHRVPRDRPKLVPRFLRKKDLRTTVTTSDTNVRITNINTIIID